eukprot:gene395-835_t
MGGTDRLESGEGCGAFVDLSILADLRSVGVDQEIDLPRIAIIGKQSSGKSSVIEALTNISLPRNSGTCTRCPIEVSTSKTDQEWHCTIQLRFSRDKNEKPLKTPLNIDFKTLSDPDEVADAISKAQTTLLRGTEKVNDDSTEDILAECHGDGPLECSFSTNVVVVSIRGKDEEDLMLTDLPGLIQATDKEEDKKYIAIIKEMCVKYVKPANTIILQCFTCSDDMNNQEVRQLAREVDKEGKRTIAVLTKPDLIQQGEQHEWLKIMQNQKFKIDFGYYIVKNRTPQELKEGSSSQEDQFFATNELIGKRIKHRLPDRCGIFSLRSRLSELLQQKVQEQLPILYHRLRQKRAKVGKELEGMPPVIDPVSASYELSTRFRDIQDDWQKQAVQERGGSKIQISLREKKERFKRSVQLFRPEFDFGGKEQFSHSDSSDWYDITAEDYVSKTYVNPEEARTCQRTYSMEEIKSMIEKNRGRAAKLPGSPAAYDTAMQIINRCCSNWLEPLYEFIDHVRSDVSRSIGAILKEKLAPFPKLYSQANAAATSLLDRKRELARKEGFKLCSLEGRMPFMTTNDHYLEMSVNAALADSVAQRVKPSLKLGEGADPCLVVKEVMKNIQEFDYVVANAQGCWKVAYKRFVDVATNSVDGILFEEFGSEISKTLFDDIVKACSKDEDFKRLVAEDQKIAARREKLKSTVKRQDEGITLLQGYVDVCALAEAELQDQRFAVAVSDDEESGTQSRKRRRLELEDEEEKENIQSVQDNTKKSKTSDTQEEEPLVEVKKEQFSVFVNNECEEELEIHWLSETKKVDDEEDDDDDDEDEEISVGDWVKFHSSYMNRTVRGPVCDTSDDKVSVLYVADDRAKTKKSVAQDRVHLLHCPYDGHPMIASDDSAEFVDVYDGDMFYASTADSPRKVTKCYVMESETSEIDITPGDLSELKLNSDE